MKNLSHCRKRSSHIHFEKVGQSHGLRAGLRCDTVSDSFSDFLCITEEVMRPLGPCAHFGDLGRVLYSSTEQQL